MVFRISRQFATDDYVDRECSPEHKLLMSILGRAIYDLRPEANHTMRKDAITWFREKETIPEKRITSFYFIKTELNLGMRLLELIEQALQEALEFEDYYTRTLQRGEEPDLKYWLSEKKSIINTTRRAFTPHVRYQKIFSIG